MRKLAFGLIGAAVVALGSMGTAAGAATIITPNSVVHPTPGQTATFFASGVSGPISATFGDTGIKAGMFTDNFEFTIAQNGIGSGSVTTSVSVNGVHGSLDLDFLSVMVNGLAATAVYRDAAGNVCTNYNVGTCGATETFAINNVPIVANVLNTISITGISRGNGSYGGQATFTPSVPEPSTWAMMLVGFGAVGFGMRRARKPARMLQAA